MSTSLVSATERQLAATRQLIMDAAFALLREAPSGPFSHEVVAARAAVSARTVYRHFPTRANLTGALWQRLREQTGTRWPRTEAEVATSIRRTFRQFEQFAALTRAAITAAAATEYAIHGSAEGRAAFRKCLADVLERLPIGEGNRLVAACVAIYSAPFWQMLRDRGQLSQRDAEQAAVAAFKALISAARRSGTPATQAQETDHER